MPRKFEAYAPDWIDVNSMLTALGADWGLLCEFQVKVERDFVQVVARCYSLAADLDAGVVVQALARRPIKSKPEIAVMAFATALDCWHQMDRGVLGAKSPGVVHDWSGRPHVARRST